MRVLLIVLFLTGCNLDIEPNLDGQVQQTESYEVFIGQLNGIASDFEHGTYNCIADQVYLEDGSAYLNDDNTQVSCNPALLTRTESSNNPREVIR